MSSRRGRPRKKTTPPQVVNEERSQVSQEFVTNQTQEHGRGQRPTKENDLIASYKAALKKNAETAKKAQATRKANKAAHHRDALSVSVSGHSEPPAQVQQVSLGSPLSHLDRPPQAQNSEPSCAPALRATSGAQSPQVPLHIPYTVQTSTHLSSLSAPVSSGAPKVQTPHQRSSSGVYATPSTTTQQHLHPGAPPSRSAPDHSLMDEFNSPLIPLTNEFSGQSNFGPRETPPGPSTQTPFHLQSLRIPHENRMPMLGSREVSLTPETPFQPRFFHTPTGQYQPLNDTDTNRSLASEDMFDEDSHPYEEPPWSQHHSDQDDDGAISVEEHEDASDLNLITRPIQLKRKAQASTRTRKMAKTVSTSHHTSNHADEESTSGPESENEGSDQDQPGRQSRGVQQLSRTSKTILNVAYEVIKRDLTVTDPFPDRDENEGLVSKTIPKQIRMAMDAWYEACGELEESRDPTVFELNRIKDRVSQFRGQLRDLARPLTAEAFGFTDVKTLNDPTAENIERIVAANRDIYATVKDKFWYMASCFDPTDTSLKDSMYRNPIIQKLLNVNWFGEGTYQRVAYFKNKTELPMVTLALELTTISCTIDEWATGRRKLVKFEAKTFSPRFQRYLKRLMDWKKFTASQSHDLATRLQETLLRNARASAADECGVENHEEEDEETTMALFTANQV